MPNFPKAISLVALCPFAAASWSGQEERFLSLAEYDRLRGQPTAGPGPGPVALEEVLVLVMASRSLAHRAYLLEDSWASSAVQRVYLVDDWLEGIPLARQWKPELQPPDRPSKVSGSGAVDKTYWSAQGRQLQYMHSFPSLTAAATATGGGAAKAAEPEAEAGGGEGRFTTTPKWVMLSDDDTWVNLERLVHFTSDHDPNVPVLFTFVLSDAHVLGYDYPCGGAGMLLSRAAYEILAPLLLTSTCPMVSFNDLTLGFCAHAQGIPVVHHPNMHCSPDINRAMRPAENLLDLQHSLAVHRLPTYPNFLGMMETLDVMSGQLGALQEHRCRLGARALDTDRGSLLDSRRFFWSADTFPSLVKACRSGAPKKLRKESLHLDFLFFGQGKPVARYQQDRRTPLVAPPSQQSNRWPEWLQQLQRTNCMDRSGLSWSAHWLDASPRLSERRVAASNGTKWAEMADLSSKTVHESFQKQVSSSPGGSWLHEIKSAAMRLKENKDARSLGPGRTWLFASFVPASTFVNIEESSRTLGALSDLHDEEVRQADLTEDVLQPRGAVDLGGDGAIPLGLAYEYFDYHVEVDGGLWLNGVALERLDRCLEPEFPIALDEGAHGNDWDTEDERLSLLWRNLLSIDLFKTLRSCGVILLHQPRMVPHAMAYLPYSTYRRSHAPSVLAALTIGNVPAREQVQAMSSLVTRRSCDVARRSRTGQKEDYDARSKCPKPAAWRLPFRMRVLGTEGDSEGHGAFTPRNWELPGARYFGMTLVAFRSEHFLPDAQAA